MPSLVIQNDYDLSIQALYEYFAVKRLTMINTMN